MGSIGLTKVFDLATIVVRPPDFFGGVGLWLRRFGGKSMGQTICGEKQLAIEFCLCEVFLSKKWD